MILNYPFYPTTYESPFIVVYPDFENEFKRILNRSGKKSRISQLYKQRLRFLDEKKVHCISHPAWFEALTGSNCNHKLYSMKIKDTLNIRALFIICKNKAILLTLFTETSENSYDIATSIAKKRIANLIDAGYIKEDDIL